MLNQIRRIIKLLAQPEKPPKKLKKTKTSAIFLDSLHNEKKSISTYSSFLSELGSNFEQKRAVVSKSQNILVLAGAGSGKTKVLTKRVIHLVKNKGLPIQNILALTFTREAKDEMIRRLSHSLELKSDALKNNVKTFHSFALQILRQDEQFEVIGEEQQKDIIERILLNLIKSDEKTAASMHSYIIQNILEKLKEKDDPHNWIKNKPEDFGSRRFKTKSEVNVRSKSERDIANYLTSIGLDWEYEKEVLWADSPFKPDFSLGNDVYIEHWCYDENTPEFSLINKKKYLEHRKWKEAQYRKYNKILISINETEMLDWQKLQERLSSILQQETKKQITKKQLSEIYELTAENKKSYEKFLDELLEIINLAKSRMLTIEEIEKNVSSEIKGKVIDFYNVLIPVYRLYEDVLRKTDYGKKDFNDLIKDSVHLLKNNKQRRDYYRERLKHILVDEFQDVSFGEVELLKLLITKKNNLFVVGDDWQSIYGWRGADVNYILHFKKDFGSHERITLPINYRSTKNIVYASSEFIQAKFNQLKKDITCTQERIADDSKIIQVNVSNDFVAARYIMHKVHELSTQDQTLKKEDFLILYRSHKNIFAFRKEFSNANFRVPFRTIHWSKGTEAKYVFVVGLKGGLHGFPSLYSDKAIKKPILKISLEDKEAEERRIFYVAMTRAKEKLFLIAENKNESEYVTEISSEYKVLDIKN